MPSTSKSQRRFFGMLLSDPERREKEGISKETAEDFASTPEKGLPEKKKPAKKKTFNFRQK